MKPIIVFASVFLTIFCGAIQVGAQQTVTADFDSSGAVDFNDFSRLISQFGLVSDSTRFQARVDLNQDNAIDGQDVFLFADVFGNTTSTANLTVSTGNQTNASIQYEPMDNGFLVYLNNVSGGIGGYRIVLSMPDTVRVRSVEDHAGMGLLPIKRTKSGVEIVGVVLGNRNLDVSGLLAGITLTGDTTGVSIQSVSLRGKRVNLGNQLFLGDRNTVSTSQIKRIPIGDVALRPRFFDLGEVDLGETRTRSFDIVNTFNNQQTLGASRKLAFEITSSSADLKVDPHLFGSVSDTSTGFSSGSSKKVTLTFKPTQTGIFDGVLSIKTNRLERPLMRVHVRARVVTNTVGTRVRAVANFDTLKLVDYGDFNELITRFGKTPDSTQFDLDKDGVIDADDAFLLADLLGGFEGRASYDTVRVKAGVNLASAVRVETDGDVLTVSVRGLNRLGGYRLNLNYDTKELDILWAKDLAGGGMMPIHRTSSGAQIVGMGFGALIETPGDMPLARIHMRPLSGQAHAASLVRVTGVLLRGEKGERDSVGAVHIGNNGLDANPRVLDFGALRIGATAQKTFRVHNLNTTSTAFQIVSSDSQVTTSPRSVGNLGGRRTWDVTVTYRSLKPGPFASTLKLSANEADTSAIQIAIKAFGAVVNVAPDSLVFNDTFIGQRTSKMVTVTNPDLTPFEIQNVRFVRTDTVFVLEPQPMLPLEVAGDGGTKGFTVRFNPLVQGEVRDTLHIVGKDTTFSVVLSGKGLRRSAMVSPVVLDYKNVDVGKDSTLFVVVKNTGNVSYKIDSLRVGRRDTSFKNVSNITFPDTLIMGRVDTFRVRFRPDTIGVKGDTLRIYGQDTTWAVALLGTGLPRPVIQPPPLEDVVVVTFSGVITKSRNEIHFGKVPWGTTDTAKVRVQNKRGVNMTFRFSTTDSQVAVKPDLVQNLPPDQEWDVILTFTPKDSIQTQSAFQITTNETGDGVTSLVLKSGGSHPVLTDSLLSFGKVSLGNHLTKTITVRNTGRSRLVLDSLTLKPDSNFVLVNPPKLPLSIAQENGTHTFSVRFKPKKRGALVDTLRFSALDTSFVLPVSGIGRESRLVFSADSLAYGLVRVGKRDTLKLVLTNAGGDSVVVNDVRIVGAGSPYALVQTVVVPDTLSPQTSRPLSIAFSPTGTGLVRDTMRVIAGLDTLRVKVLGTGAVARATLSSHLKNLGSVSVGRMQLDTVTVNNAGNVPIFTRSVKLTQGNRGFALVQTPKDTLKVNGSLQYVIRFQPDTTGVKRDSLRIDMVDTVFSVAFVAEGKPSITVTRTDNGISFDPAQLDFGLLNNTQTGHRIVRVVNTASTPWTFTTQIDEPGLTIKPGTFTGLPTEQGWNLATTWTPRENGPQLTTLKIKTDTDLPIPVGRNGAFLKLLTDSLAYGQVRVAKDSIRVIRIRNTGQAIVGIQSVNVMGEKGFTLVSPPQLPLSLSDKDSLNIRVRFRPLVSGDVVDSVKVVAADTVFVVALKGRGIEPVIALNKLELDFGSVVSGRDSTLLIVVQNVGNGPFVLDSLKLVTSTSAFAMTKLPTTPDSILSGGDADTVAIRFRPPDLGTYSAKLHIYGDKKVWTIPVVGKSNQTGSVASGITFTFGTAVTRSDTVLNFGNIPIGATRRISFEINNARDSVFTFSVASLNPEIKVESISTQALLPNQSATVTIAFTPVVGGILSADLNIVSNASTDGTVNLKVIKDRPPVRVEPLVLNFGSVQIGHFDTLKTQIVNPQILNYIVSQRTFLKGVGFSLFAPRTLPDTVKANGGTRSLNVKFEPKTRGTIRDTLRITGGSQSFDVALIGQGILALAESSVDTLTFGVVDVGADSIRSFSITNTGDVTLRLNEIAIEGTHFVLQDTLAIPDTLGMGQSHTFGVRYAPTSGGQHTGKVRFTWGTQKISVVLQGTGLAPPRIQAGPIALDMNLDVGDQGLRRLGVSGQSVVVDVAVTEGALGTSGVNVVLAFDTTAVAFKEFVLTELYDGATPIITGAADSVKFSVVYFGSDTTSRNVGSVGHARFTVLAGADSTGIRIVRASFAKAGEIVPQEIGLEGAVVRVKGSAEPSPDFDGDGEVGFTDFILFAGKFGTKSGEPAFDIRFDLDRDGSVGFTDFIAFAGKFGTQVEKPVLSKPIAK